MTETVACAECGNHYDSDTQPFCTRCGALEKRVDHGDGPHPAIGIADRRDPRRRRVQAAGIMLLTIGAVTGVLFLVTAIMAPTLVPQTMDAFASQSGGDLRVLVVAGDSPVAGANITALGLDGMELANGTTDAAGWANFTALAHAGVNLTVTHGGEAWQRNVLTLDGLHTGDGAQRVRIDTESEPGAAGVNEWQGVEAFVTGSRIVAGLFALVAAITVAGGVAAVRLKGRRIAMTGAVVGGLPWLVLFFASLSPLVFAVLAAFVLAAFFLQQGRAVFAS